ncbi:MAG: NAD(P)H-binding protein [Nitrososphaera sp.]|nr:NAD(P)H-binding protein [Nitrososphaera sp.]
MMSTREIFVTGGTGYIGRRLIALLLARGHRVRALARPGSVGRLPAGAVPIIGDALDAGSFTPALRTGDTVIHLVGTPHPNPSKATEFLRVDLASVRAAVAAARLAQVSHFVYVSVAQPAPVMRAYLAARAEGEKLISEVGLTSTILRPWYVLGPGHWWPLVLAPMYALAKLFPQTRAGARRLGLVTLQQMVNALVWAAENSPAQGTMRLIEVPEIRKARPF